MAIVEALLAGDAIGFLTPVAHGVALPVLGMLAIGVVGHAPFVDGPVDEFEDLTEEVEPEAVPMMAAAAGLAD
ncbi:hypothetical protein [Halovivax sp.]|uniref:hypothetical protein n=1 Tax=Halovivax sp. TaxID=1935978 RepID=UPI0025BB887A|nr:hypothetical protein [Halovivax sp.]